MTQEVVTQYYRAPELLMGAKYYTQAIDIWSVGCIFGELLGRRILFQAATPIQQLDRITDLLGTPSAEEVRRACDGAKSHVLRKPFKPPNVNTLYHLGANSTQDAIHLLSTMLTFDYEKRFHVLECLDHPYLDEGRLRYHSCMCSCCGPEATNPPPPGGGRADYPHSWEEGMRNQPGFRGASNSNLEPIAPVPFQHTYEDDVSTHDFRRHDYGEAQSGTMSRPPHEMLNVLLVDNFLEGRDAIHSLPSIFPVSSIDSLKLATNDYPPARRQWTNSRYMMMLVWQFIHCSDP